VLPFVSIVVPTRNRRLFAEQLVRNVLRQDYPPSRTELLVADDGEDPVEDVLRRVPELRYLRLADPTPIGAKRNLLAREARGEIIVHMDDDDYYAPTRVSHAVAALQGSGALLAGASELHIYDVIAKSMRRAGPFRATHATAGTMAYCREYLHSHAFDEAARAQEEPAFTEGFSAPMVQLQARLTMVCIAHSGNTFAKDSAAAGISPLKLTDLIRCPEALRFYRYQLPRRLSAGTANR
jgi:glycosyltransferase involved in cell wall biosynthesis